MTSTTLSRWIPPRIGLDLYVSCSRPAPNSLGTDDHTIAVAQRRHSGLDIYA